jgi:hypothetical protein
MSGKNVTTLLDISVDFMTEVDVKQPSNSAQPTKAA